MTLTANQMTSDRFLRQQHAFPEARRQTSMVAIALGDVAPDVTRFLMAGAASMGVPRVASDFHGWPDANAHWLMGEHSALVRHINEETEYVYLDPEAYAEDLKFSAEGWQNAWLAVICNDVVRAREVVGRLAGAGLRLLLVWVGPSGIVVDRHGDPASASARLAEVGPGGKMPPATMELSILAAGVSLNEVMFAGQTQADDLKRPRTVAYYSLHRPRRCDMPPDASVADLVADVARPVESRAVFTGRRLELLGAGALANWTAPPIACDGGVRCHVTDGDLTIEEHNLNRQILLTHHVGRAKAPVLADELARLDPAGEYTHTARFAKAPADLPLESVDLLIAAPDNNEARLLAGECAREAGVLFGQGGSGGTGGQLSVHAPGRACYPCLAGASSGAAPAAGANGGGNSCWRVNADSVVSSNMVVAALLVSELRVALAGGRTQNLRFEGNSDQGNRLARMLNDAPCPHKAAVSGMAR